MQKCRQQTGSANLRYCIPIHSKSSSPKGLRWKSYILCFRFLQPISASWQPRAVYWSPAGNFEPKSTNSDSDSAGFWWRMHSSFEIKILVEEISNNPGLPQWDLTRAKWNTPFVSLSEVITKIMAYYTNTNKQKCQPIWRNSFTCLRCLLMTKESGDTLSVPQDEHWSSFSRR